MTDQELMSMVKDMLVSVAPDLEGEQFDPDESIRDQFEIDSMDFLNFIVALSKRTGLEIPEATYPDLQSLSGAARWLRVHWSEA